MRGPVALVLSAIAYILLMKNNQANPALQVMTVVEGKISKARTSDFLSMYASVGAQAKPPGWKRSMLLRDPDEEGLYRISTLWDSREALEQMRKNTKAPDRKSTRLNSSHGSISYAVLCWTDKT